MAERAGFRETQLLVEMPHASRACKIFLCASKRDESAVAPETAATLKDGAPAHPSRRRVSWAIMGLQLWSCLNLSS